MVQEIDSLELEGRLSDDGDMVLLDIRSDAEWERGVLPKAQHLPMHLIPLRIHEFPRNKKLVLYCHSGARSYQACMFLMRQGVDNVLHLRGGIIDWARNGLQIVAPA